MLDDYILCVGWKKKPLSRRIELFVGQHFIASARSLQTFSAFLSSLIPTPSVVCWLALGIVHKRFWFLRMLEIIEAKLASLYGTCYFHSTYLVFNSATWYFLVTHDARLMNDIQPGVLIFLFSFFSLLQMGWMRKASNSPPRLVGLSPLRPAANASCATLNRLCEIDYSSNETSKGREMESSTIRNRTLSRKSRIGENWKKWEFFSFNT